MNDRHINRTLILALLLLGLVLAILLGLALQGFTRATLITPLLYLAWMADLIFRSIPGWLWWGWFLVIALVIAGQSLRVRRGRQSATRGRRLPAVGAVRAWLGRVSAIGQGDYFRWRLAHELAELSLKWLAARDRRALAHSERTEYRTEYIQTLNAPPDVQAYLLAGLQMPQGYSHSWLSRVRLLTRPIQRNSPLELDPHKAVEFLEGQLERKDDD